MDPNDITKRRQTLTKTGVNFEDLRRRRNEQTVELRKNKREDILCKKRSQRSDGLDDDSDNLDGIEPIDFTQISDEHLNKVLANVYHFEQNIQLCHMGVKTIRKYLSQDNNPPIDRLLDFGVLSPLVRCLTMDDAPNIQFEAAWAITNIASGTSEQTHKVVTSGAPIQLRRLIYSKVSKIAEQSFWAFGNIVGDGPYLRDYIVKMDIIKCILEFVCGPLELTFLRNITWVVVNLCRYKDPPLEFREFQRLVPALVKLLTYQDRSVLIDSLWAISYATDCGTEYINEVIRSGMVVQVVPNLSHAETAIQTAALRALGNIVTGSDEQTQAVLDCNVLSHFTFLLSHEKARIRKEAVWFISNIAAGSALQIQKLIDANILPLVAENLRHGDFTIKKEAIWAISNLTINGTRDHIVTLINLGILPQFCDFLQYEDAQLVQIILEGILNMLRVEDIHMHKSLITMIEECGGLDRIENLQTHENSDIYKMAYNIIETYFNENAEDTSLVPDSTNDNFVFHPTEQQNFDFSNL